MQPVIVAVLAAAGCAVMFLPCQAGHVAKSSPASASEWEYQAVAFGLNEKQGTKKLNDLAQDGWEYVGPLSNRLAAFKKRLPSAQDIELAKLQGTWILVSREEGGHVTRAANDSTTFTVSGHQWVWKNGGAVFQADTFTLTDIAQNPKQWEYAVLGGGIGYSIYQVDGDSFKYCSSGSAQTRPTEFTTQPDNGRYCCIWKRAMK